MTVGPRCTELSARLLGDHIAERLRAAQGVIALGKRYGVERLEVACTRALAHDSRHFRTVIELRQPELDEIGGQAVLLLCVAPAKNS